MRENSENCKCQENDPLMKPSFLGKVSFSRRGMVCIKTRKTSVMASKPN